MISSIEVRVESLTLKKNQSNSEMLSGSLDILSAKTIARHGSIG